MLFLPNERIGERNEGSKKKSGGVFGQYYSFIVAMFILMFTFFVYPSSFAMETVKEGIIDDRFISVIMASMDFIAFFGGLSFVHIKKIAGSGTKFVAPALFTLGYGFLYFIGGWAGAIVGSLFIGFANGLGIPFIIATASKKAGRSAATTVLPLISIALYLAQFTTPFILSLVEGVFSDVFHLPYLTAVFSGVLLILWSLTIKEDSAHKDKVR